MGGPLTVRHCNHRSNQRVQTTNVGSGDMDQKIHHQQQQNRTKPSGHVGNQSVENNAKENNSNSNSNYNNNSNRHGSLLHHRAAATKKNKTTSPRAVKEIIHEKLFGNSNHSTTTRKSTTSSLLSSSSSSPSSSSCLVWNHDSTEPAIRTNHGGPAPTHDSNGGGSVVVSEEAFPTRSVMNHQNNHTTMTTTNRPSFSSPVGIPYLLQQHEELLLATTTKLISPLANSSSTTSSHNSRDSSCRSSGGTRSRDRDANSLPNPTDDDDDDDDDHSRQQHTPPHPFFSPNMNFSEAKRLAMGEKDHDYYHRRHHHHHGNSQEPTSTRAPIPFHIIAKTPSSSIILGDDGSSHRTTVSPTTQMLDGRASYDPESKPVVDDGITMTRDVLTILIWINGLVLLAVHAGGILLQKSTLENPTNPQEGIRMASFPFVNDFSNDTHFGAGSGGWIIGMAFLLARWTVKCTLLANLVVLGYIHNRIMMMVPSSNDSLRLPFLASRLRSLRTTPKPNQEQSQS